MRDTFGEVLEVGDSVVALSGSSLCQGLVKEFDGFMVVVEVQQSTGVDERAYAPHRIAKKSG